MPHLRGKLMDGDRVLYDAIPVDFEEGPGPAPWQGHFELPVGGSVAPGQQYRVALEDGRAGPIRITAYNDISTVAEFEGTGPLA